MKYKCAFLPGKVLVLIKGTPVECYKLMNALTTINYAYRPRTPMIEINKENNNMDTDKDGKYATKKKKGALVAQNVLFLNSKGRVLFDSFVYNLNQCQGEQVHEDIRSRQGIFGHGNVIEKGNQSNQSTPDRDKLEIFDESGSIPQFLLEIDLENKQTALGHFRKYLARSKIQVKVLEGFGVGVVWDSERGGNKSVVTTKRPLELKNEMATLGAGIKLVTNSLSVLPFSWKSLGLSLWKDSRPVQCQRFIVKTNGLSNETEKADAEKADIKTSEIETPSLKGNQEYQLSTVESYTQFRIQNGIAEGPTDYNSNPTTLSLPFDMNADLVGSVDFKKGCYLGQELTHRTKSLGVVRKRMVIIEICRGDSTDFQVVDPGTLIYNVGDIEKRGRSVGRTCSWSKETGMGLAVLKLDMIGVELELDKSGLRVISMQPPKF